MSTRNFTCLYYLIVYTLLKGWQVEADEQEYRLIRYLMSNYDPAVRPSVNASLPLRVLFQLSVRQIVDVDEDNQVLTTNCWLTQKWNDVHLRWNATDFSGISAVRIPSDQVWKPDILLYNNADVEASTNSLHANVILHSTGDIIWLSRGIFRSSCEMDVQFFPFDVQNCMLKFSSWTHDTNQVEIVLERGDEGIVDLHPNGQFELDGFVTKLHLQKFSCCDQFYHMLTYTISLRRRPLHFILNLVLPCFIVNIVSVFSFCVPCRSGEKLTLSIGSFISIMFLLTSVKNSLPQSQTTPLITIYYGATLTMVTFAALFSVFTVSIHHRGLRGTEVPVCVKKLVLGCMAKALFVSFSTQKKESHKKSSSVDVVRESKAGLDRIEHYTVSPRLRHRSETPIAAVSTNVDTMRQSRPLQGEEQQFERRFLRILHEVHETMERNEHRVADQEHRETVRTEWEQVASVCDRFFLVLFVLFAFLTVFLILFISSSLGFHGY